MWLFTQHGFYSIVADRNEPGRHLIRAHFRSDLKNLMKVCGLRGTIRTIIGTHYPHRISIPSDRLPAVLGTMAGLVDYPDFKAHIATLPDQADRAEAYHRVWQTVADLPMADCH